MLFALIDTMFNHWPSLAFIYIYIRHNVWRIPFLYVKVVLLVMTAVSNTVVVHCVNAHAEAVHANCMHAQAAGCRFYGDDKYLFMINLILKPECSKLINATKCTRYIRIMCEGGGG